MRLLFDHGTLVLVDPPDTNLDFLPGLLWDPRVALWRAPAHHYRDLLAALKKHQLPLVNEACAGALTPEPWAPISLRPYQRAALLAWELADSSGVVCLPTGAGKTRVALAAMAETRARTLCLVPTRALLHQWRSELARFYPGAIGCLGDGRRDVRAITVSTFESALRQMPRLGNQFGLLVVDEVHHFGTGVKDEALEMSTAPLRLGLTATPPGDEAFARVQELVGPLVYHMAVGDLAGKWLSDFDLLVLRLTLNPTERARYQSDYAEFQKVHRHFRKHYPQAKWRDFVATASESSEGRMALLAWQRARNLLSYTQAKAAAVGKLLRQHATSRVLIFTANNAAAYAISRDYLIMPITCEIKRRERERALALFRSGELNALVSARVLNEGIDVPEADVAIIVGGAQGEREHVQRVGRLLRPVPGKRALVYELVTLATSEARQAAERRRGLAATSAVSA